MAPDNRERRGEDEEGLSNLASAYQKAGPYIAASTTLVASVGPVRGGRVVDRQEGRVPRSPGSSSPGRSSGWSGGFISFFRQVLGKQKK